MSILTSQWTHEQHQFNANNTPLTEASYHETLQQLIYLQNDDVTVFYGGPLDLPGDNDVWLSPVEVTSGSYPSYLQALFINGRPEELIHNPKVPVTILDINEADFKLTESNHPDFISLDNELSANGKRVIIRRCNEGMAYYPQVASPDQTNHRSTTDYEKVVSMLGLREPKKYMTLGENNRVDETSIAVNGMTILHARKSFFRGGEIFSYGVTIPDDPWKYYEIFSPNSLGTMATKNMLVRVDSGCDIGQVFDDRGCDCREQLHTALEDIILKADGAIIHIPAQDGRGYGAATKMETEGHKRGIPVVKNLHDPTAVDTIEAALRVIGTRFDIRTYGGAGRILGALGVESVTLQTDNKKKISGIEQAGINVTRKKTGTTGANGSIDHVLAKHKYPEIYFNSHEQVG